MMPSHRNGLSAMDAPQSPRRIDVGRYPARIVPLLTAAFLMLMLCAALVIALFHFTAQWWDGPYHVSSATRVMPEGDYSLLWSAGKMAAAGAAAGHAVAEYPARRKLRISGAQGGSEPSARPADHAVCRPPLAI